jgi:crcB protein
MTNLLLVGGGGFIGAIARYALGGGVAHFAAQAKFPFSTFLVNLTGCFIIGILAGLSAKHELFSQEAKLFLFTGLLGGFTTFSAFGLETVVLLRRGESLIAAAYVGSSVMLGIAAVWLGIKTIYLLSR